MKIKKKKLEDVNKRFFVPEEFRTSSKYWDFNKDGLSPSAILTFLNCREQFRLAWVEGWRTPTQYSFHREWGSLFHFLHKKWVTGEYDSLRHHLDEWQEKFAERVIATPAIAQQQELGYALVKAVWPEYCKKWRDDLERDWFLYESTIKLEYEDTVLVGQVDGGWREKRGASLHEMKTHAQINPVHFVDSLHLDFQMMFYAYLMKRVEGRVATGVKDVVRRPSSTPSGRGQESFQAFVKRLRETVQKTPSHYFMRFFLDNINDSLEDWERLVLRPIVAEIRAWVKKKSPHYVSGVHALIPRPWGSEYFNPICLRDFSEMRREKAFAYHKKD